MNSIHHNIAVRATAGHPGCYGFRAESEAWCGARKEAEMWLEAAAHQSDTGVVIDVSMPPGLVWSMASSVHKAF